LLIRRIRELLYEQGFTISGARNRLGEIDVREEVPAPAALQTAAPDATPSAAPAIEAAQFDFTRLRGELRGLLSLLRSHAA
ncbi:MAG: MerR family transcriptional regulator, partial [Methylobacterium sp.]|nr:MerR family transcriptional regulator [Methylobacterium sp.]